MPAASILAVISQNLYRKLIVGLKTFQPLMFM
jgi:hypothetical protein